MKQWFKGLSFDDKAAFIFAIAMLAFSIYVLVMTILVNA
jgi:hypothetical protein